MNAKQAILIVIVLAGLGFLVWRGLPKKAEQPQPVAPNQTWETKTDEQGPVAIKATPLDLSKGAGVWRFIIVFDTHTGALEDDPLQAVRLVDDQGKDYVPKTWDGPGPGGHHREGTLTFIAINPAPPYVELKISNVGGIPERKFKWSLEKK